MTKDSLTHEFAFHVLNTNIILVVFKNMYIIICNYEYLHICLMKNFRAINYFTNGYYMMNDYYFIDK